MKGIICALKEEAAPFLEGLKYVKRDTIGGVEFTKGKLDGVDIVVAVCGVGKVAAAACTQSMITKYSPELIINSGVAGCTRNDLHCGDIVIARNTIQHDIDTTALGDPKGFVSGLEKINFVCDKDVVAAFKAITEAKEYAFKLGVIATGDKFISDKKDKEFLKIWFGASACDMEAGAINHVCFLNKVPFASIRALSDEANGRSKIDYTTFLPEAAQKAAEIVKEYLTTPINE